MCYITAEMLKGAATTPSTGSPMSLTKEWIPEQPPPLPPPPNRGLEPGRNWSAETAEESHFFVSQETFQPASFSPGPFQPSEAATISNTLGFMPNCSTVDRRPALPLIIETTQGLCQDRRLCITSLNLNAACDLMDHLSLWKIPTTAGALERSPLRFKGCGATIKAPAGSPSTAECPGDSELPTTFSTPS